VEADEMMRKIHERLPSVHPVRVQVTDPVTGEEAGFYVGITEEYREYLTAETGSTLAEQVVSRIAELLMPKHRGRRQENQERDLRLWSLVRLDRKTYRQATIEVGLMDEDFVDEDNAIDMAKKAVRRVDRWLVEAEELMERRRQGT
jgi:hypothetical protein